eukprot:11780621-Karenia_brevis.AAC.1
MRCWRVFQFLDDYAECPRCHAASQSTGLPSFTAPGRAASLSRPLECHSPLTAYLSHAHPTA